MRAWTREISLSPPRLPRPGVERPTTSSCSRAIDEPAALPATTLRDSPAIGGQPNHGVGRTASPAGAEITRLLRNGPPRFPDPGVNVPGGTSVRDAEAVRPPGTATGSPPRRG